MSVEEILNTSPPRSRHAPVTKYSAWGELGGFTNAILAEVGPQTYPALFRPIIILHDLICLSESGC